MIRKIPRNEPFLVLLKWVIVIPRSVSPSWDQTGTLDSAPELVFRKRGSPSTLSTWSLQAASRLSSSRTLRNTNFAYFSPYAGMCVLITVCLFSFNSLTDIQRPVYAQCVHHFWAGGRFRSSTVRVIIHILFALLWTLKLPKCLCPGRTFYT